VGAKNYSEMHHNLPEDSTEFGGGFIEPLGFNSELPISFIDHPLTQSYYVKIDTPISPFQLSDALSCSTSFFSNPNSQYAPSFLSYPLNQRETDSYCFDFGDSELLGGAPVLSMLLRKVQNIIIFLNSNIPLEKSNDGEISFANLELDRLFGRKISEDNNFQVFESEQYDNLINGLYMSANYQENEPQSAAIYKQQYKILECENIGLIDTNEYQPTILWVYLNPVKTWEKLLRDKELIESLKLGQQEQSKLFKNFPNYPKAMGLSDSENAVLSTAEVRLLAHFTSWIVVNNRNVFESMFK